MSKSKLKWSEKEEEADFDAAFQYLSLLCSDRKASALVKSLRGSKILEHAAKDMLRAANLPLLPRDDPIWFPEVAHGGVKLSLPNARRLAAPKNDEGAKAIAEILHEGLRQGTFRIEPSSARQT